MAGKVIIWMDEERTFGVLVERGAHMSRVVYYADRMLYDVYVENDEFTILEEDE